LHRFTRSEPIREKAPHLSARLSGWLVKGAFTLCHCQFLMGQVLTGKSPPHEIRRHLNLGGPY
jgi:hypothetical protein